MEPFEAVYRAGWSSGGDRPRSFRMWVAAAGSERLRLEIAGRLGGTWLSVAVAGGEITAVSVRSGEHLRARVRPGLLGSVTGWPLEAEEMPRLLLGCPHIRATTLEVRYGDWREEGGAHVPGRVTVERPGESKEILSLVLESLAMGPVPPEMFALQPPPGSRAVSPAPEGAATPLWDFTEAP
jgi:hypothetical protein